MHVKERVQRVLGAIRRHKRAAVALLLVAPLLTGAGTELFALNTVGLGIGALILRRFTRPRGKAQTATQQRRTR